MVPQVLSKHKTTKAGIRIGNVVGGYQWWRSALAPRVPDRSLGFGRGGERARRIDREQLMNADGSDQVQLTTDPADDFGPAWSPAGTRIAFVSTRTGVANVYVMNADGTHQTALLPGPNRQAVPAGSRVGCGSDANAREGGVIRGPPSPLAIARDQ